MRITGPGQNQPMQGKKGGHRQGDGSGFSVSVEGEAAQTASASSASAGTAVTGIEALLALQSVDAPDERERRQVQRGHDLLDQLEALRADLLAGTVAAERLGAIMGTLRAQAPADDPKLGAIIADIELRARVELAKLGQTV